jgi:pectate lyase
MKLHPMHILLLAALALQAQTVKIREAGGWLESAWISWDHVAGAERYNVLVSGGGLTDKKLDDALIRQYNGTIRADIPGLKAGSYTFKVSAVVGGNEGAASTSAAVTVRAHDRAGFAFSGGRIAGAYNTDGTPMTDAVIVYITEKTKDAVSLTVTGATANPCVGFQNILYGIKKGKDARPFIFRLVGNVTDPAVLDGGDLVIENDQLETSHITLEGIGEDAVANGWGIRLKNASNVEIRNLGIMNVNSSEGDDIGLQQSNDHVWVHNVDFFYGMAGGDADQAKGDGSLDCKKSTYVTFSYNRFWDNGKVHLLGLSEGTTQGLYITYHHNWYDHSDSRHPRVRYYSAHVYNNYYDGNAKYGVGSTLGSSVFVEGNSFRHCKYPILTSMQGSDVWSEAKKANDYANMPTFSSEDGGSIKAWNNAIEGATRFVPYGSADFANSKVDFDAYVAGSRTEKVPATVKSAYGANVYNNFDTDAAVMYTYTADAPEAAKTNVTTYAGRVRGGDFKWTFDNAVDDTSSAVNQPLKTALAAYKSPILRIQGEGAFLSPVGVAPRSTATLSLAVVSGHLVLPDGLAATSVEVRTVSGALVRQGELENRSLDLHGLGKGLYLARIAVPGGDVVQPFALAR